MTTFFEHLFPLFLSAPGLLVLATLDSSMLFFLPLAVDATVVILTARQTHLFFLFPLLATAGSLAGAAITFSLGRKIGEAGIEHWVPQRVRKTIREKGAITMAVPALLPPPFPLTPFILACGALSVSRWHFFITLGIMRLVRYGTLSVLGMLYGGQILATLQSQAFKIVVGLLFILALVGTAYGVYRLASNTRRHGAVRTG